APPETAVSAECGRPSALSFGAPARLRGRLVGAYFPVLPMSLAPAFRAGGPEATTMAEAILLRTKRKFVPRRSNRKTGEASKINGERCRTMKGPSRERVVRVHLFEHRGPEEGWEEHD